MRAMARAADSTWVRQTRTATPEGYC